MYKKKVNIMPMAGEGLRFKKAGYDIPKPLIDVKGKPMFIRSAQCMPDADLWIFITQKKFLENGQIDKEIKKELVKNGIVKVTYGIESSTYEKFLARDLIPQELKGIINIGDEVKVI